MYQDRNRFSRVLRCIGLAAAGLCVVSSAVAKPEKTKIVLGYASMSGGFGSFWVAKERGYFAKEGLNVELLYTRTTVGLQALSSGNIDAMGTGCAEFFEATRKGFENRIVASLFEHNLYLLASRKEITKPEMLIGKAVAVNRMGDTGHLSVRFALRKLGVDPDKVTYLQVGSTPERFSALARGSVAGAVQVGALKPLIKKNKFNVLIDLQSSEYPSCLGGIGVRAKWTQSHPETINALLRAIVRGNAYLAAGPAEETKKIFSKYMKLRTDDKKLLLSWSFFAKDAHARKPIMTVASAKGVMDMMAEADKSWSKEDPKRFLDLSFMRKLDQAGFLDAVYAEIEKDTTK